MAGWIKMPLGMEVGLDPSDIVLDRDPTPLSPKGGRAPQFSAHVCCGQTPGWIKMPLGTMVDLGPGNIVLDADPAQPREGHRAPPPPKKKTFGPCLLWPSSWMDQDATWYEGRPRSWPHCVTWGPSSPPKRGTAPNFLAHVYLGQTVAHLSYCWALVYAGTRRQLFRAAGKFCENQLKACGLSVSIRHTYRHLFVFRKARGAWNEKL